MTLLVVERPTLWRSLLLGIVTGVSMLGNSRLVFLPIICAAFIVWRLPRTRISVLAAACVLAGAAVAVLPWLIRNEVSVGCFTLTTDGRAMWKANNLRTHELLASGQWIDNVGPNSSRPAIGSGGYLTPEDANGRWLRSRGASKPHPNECLEMNFYQDKALHFWVAHPRAKASLMVLSAKLLWQPNVLETSGRNGSGGQLDVGRRVVEPAYMVALYVLALVGLFLVPRAFAVFAALLLAYQTAAALAFVGATRYRVPWDFLLAILASAALERALTRFRTR